jgi:hypothetical protein
MRLIWLRSATGDRHVLPDVKQLRGCGHLFSDKHNGAEIQASFVMIVCMLILIYTREKANRAMDQMVRYEVIGLASPKELEAFIRTRRQPAPAKPPRWTDTG